MAHWLPYSICSSGFLADRTPEVGCFSGSGPATATDGEQRKTAREDGAGAGGGEEPFWKVGTQHGLCGETTRFRNRKGGTMDVF